MSGGNGFLKGTIDPKTNMISQVTGDHRYIHEGAAFSISETIPSLAAAASSYIGFTTPATATKEIHFRPSVISSSANIVRAEIYEAASFTGGDEIIPVNRNRQKTNLANVVIRKGVTSSPTASAIVTTKAGGNFANQPAGDAVDVVSDANDLTQDCIIYGTTSAALSTITSETVTLTGSAAVTTTITNWQTILGIELSASCAGTITVSESSGSAAITTISTTVLSAGVQVPTSTDGKLQIPLHEASGASTKSVGILGTGSDGAVLSYVDALNGATSENHGTAVYDTITKVFIGDVESARTVTISVPNVKVSNGTYGSGGGPRSRSGGAGGSEHELVLKESTSYVAKVTNIGASTATDVDILVFWYEEEE